MTFQFQQGRCPGRLRDGAALTSSTAEPGDKPPAQDHEALQDLDGVGA